jgi:hypothetical protein
MRTFAPNILVLILLGASSVYASEIDYAATFSLTSYENILRVENPQGDELAETVRLSSSWTENTINFIASISAGIESTRFSKEIQDNRNEGDLNADLLWVISPNRYEWILTDIYTHTAIDPRLTDTPLNRQYINAFTTGPNFKWRLAKTTYINIEPRIEDYRFENDLLNNQRVNTRVEWLQTPGENTEYGFDVFYETTNYTSTSLVDSDYDQIDFNINIGYTRNNLSIEARNGITKIDSNNYDNGNKSQYRLYINNQRTRTSNIEIALGKNVTDTSRTVNSLDPDVDTDSLLSASSDLYTNKYITVGYTKTYRNLDFTLEAEKRDEDYFTQNNLDRKVDSATFSSQWMNTRNSRLRLRYNISEAEYPLDINNRFDDDSRTSLEYVYRINSNLSYTLSIFDISRDSTAPGESFEDTVLMLSITYATRSRDS